MLKLMKVFLKIYGVSSWKLELLFQTLEELD